jgi:peptidoglycan/LPS O-acetylase OafA/YrhL
VIGPKSRPTAAVPIPATPVSYLFRSGTCVLGLACAYWLEQWRSRRAAGPSTDGPTAGWRAAWARFTPLLWLGQASMTVYMVHLDLVYNIWSYPIKHKLTPAAASALLGLLTALMIWLAYYRTARHARPRSRPVLASSAAVAPVNPLSKPKAS